MTLECWICGSPHDSEAAVVEHVVRKQDPDHADWTDRGDVWVEIRDRDLDPESADSEATNDPMTNDPPTDPTSGDDPAAQMPPAREGEESSSSSSDPPSAQCCDDPELVDVPRGNSFVTEDGRTGVTDPGDQFCKHCEAIVEDDGGIIR